MEDMPSYTDTDNPDDPWNSYNNPNEPETKTSTFDHMGLDNNERMKRVELANQRRNQQRKEKRDFNYLDADDHEDHREPNYTQETPSENNNNDLPPIRNLEQDVPMQKDELKVNRPHVPQPRQVKYEIELDEVMPENKTGEKPQIAPKQKELKKNFW